MPTPLDAATAVVFAGAPAHNDALYHRARFLCGDPTVWIDLPKAGGGRERLLILRDIEMDRGIPLLIRLFGQINRGETPGRRSAARRRCVRGWAGAAMSTHTVVQRSESMGKSSGFWIPFLLILVFLSGLLIGLVAVHQIGVAIEMGPVLPSLEDGCKTLPPVASDIGLLMLAAALCLCLPIGVLLKQFSLRTLLVMVMTVGGVASVPFLVLRG